MPVGGSTAFIFCLALFPKDEVERLNIRPPKKCERGLLLGPGSISALIREVSLELSAACVCLRLDIFLGGIGVGGRERGSADLILAWLATRWSPTKLALPTTILLERRWYLYLCRPPWNDMRLLFVLVCGRTRDALLASSQTSTSSSGRPSILEALPSIGFSWNRVLRFLGTLDTNLSEKKYFGF
jgi:hypothetical protein